MDDHNDGGDPHQLFSELASRVPPRKMKQQADEGFCLNHHRKETPSGDEIEQNGPFHFRRGSSAPRTCRAETLCLALQPPVTAVLLSFFSQYRATQMLISKSTCSGAAMSTIVSGLPSGVIAAEATRLMTSQ